MVMAPEMVKKEWILLRENPVVLGQEFWNFWNERWQPYYLELKQLVNKNIGGEISAFESNVLYKLLKKLTFFIDTLRANKEKFALNTTVRSLIAHHIGNGIYLIFCIANVTEDTVEPILTENVHKISIAVNDMEQFWNDLREIEELKKRLIERGEQCY